MSAGQQRQQERKDDRYQGYITVAERIDQFYARYPDGRIVTTIVEHDAERGFILMRAEVYRNPDDAMPAATGHAYEIKGEGYVNKTSHIENCETGCVGRALANCGFEVKRGIASREDMERSAARESQAATKPAPVAGGTVIATELQVRQIDEYESSLEEYDVTRKFLHDKLEEKYKTREPARLTTSEASDYLEWLKALLGKKRGQ
jgi:hypothetical protein